MELSTSIIILFFLVFFSFLLAYKSHKHSERMHENVKVQQTLFTPVTFEEEEKQKLLNARFEAEANQNFLIFWAVLFFTCVIGQIEWLSINGNWSKFSIIYQSSLSILYFGLVLGIMICIHFCFTIYRRVYRLTYSGRLGPYRLKDAIDDQTIIDKVIRKKIDLFIEMVILLVITAIFLLLFLGKIGWL